MNPNNSTRNKPAGSQSSRPNTSTNTSANPEKTPLAGPSARSAGSKINESDKPKISVNAPSLVRPSASKKAPVAVRSIPAQPIKPPISPQKKAVRPSGVQASVRPAAPAPARKVLKPAPTMAKHDDASERLWKAQAIVNANQRNKALLELSKDSRVLPLQRLEAAKAIGETAMHDQALRELSKDPALLSHRKQCISAITNPDLRAKGLRSLKQVPQRPVVVLAKAPVAKVSMPEAQPQPIRLKPAPIELSIHGVLKPVEQAKEEKPPISKQLTKDDKHRTKAMDSNQSGLNRFCAANEIKDTLLKDDTLLALVKDANIRDFYKQQAVEAISDATKKAEAEAIIKQARRDVERQKDETLRRKVLDSDQSGLNRFCAANEIKDALLKDDTLLALVKDANIEDLYKQQAAEAIKDATKKAEAEAVIEQAERDVERQKDETLRGQALDSSKTPWGRFWAANDIKDKSLKDDTLLALVKDPAMDLDSRNKATQAINDATKKVEAEAILDQAAQETALDDNKNEYIRTKALEYIKNESTRESVLLSFSKDPEIDSVECSKAVLKMKDKVIRDQALLALVLHTKNMSLKNSQLLPAVSDDKLLLAFLKASGFESPKAVEFIKDPVLQQEGWYYLALAPDIWDSQRKAAINKIQDPFKKAEVYYALAMDLSLNKDKRLEAAKALVPWVGCSYKQEKAIERMQEAVWSAIATNKDFYFNNRHQAADKILDVSKRDEVYCSLVQDYYKKKDNIDYDTGIAIASNIVDDTLRLKVYREIAHRVFKSFSYITRKHNHHLSDWITSNAFPQDSVWYYAVATAIESDIQWYSIDKIRALNKYLSRLNAMEGEAREEKFRELFNDPLIHHEADFRCIARAYVKDENEAQIDRVLDDMRIIRSDEANRRFKRMKPAARDHDQLEPPAQD